MPRVLPIFCAFLLLLTLTLPATAQNSYTEDFTTPAFKDPVNTTADWNTTDGEDNTIVRARLVTTQSAGVSWEASADAGAFFQPFVPGGGWTQFSNIGTDLLWRSTHNPTSTANPAVSGLTFEWLNEYGHIQSVTDIANDQGRQVSLEWQRSGYDFVGDPQQIVEYAVYRPIDPALKASDMAALPSGASTALQAHASSAKAAGWHFIMTVPVRAQDDYAVVVPTLADSTVAGGQSLSTFMVSALTTTPGVFFDSPVASGYSVDNLAPGIPAALLAAFSPTEVVLDWDDSEDVDFQYYRIYRDTNPAFVPSAGNLVQQVVASGWSDPTGNAWNFHYKVTAVDFAGNESETAEPQSVSSADSGALPMRTALLGAYPNPFNPSTKLSFELAAPAHARLKIFDAAGRLVTTLVDEQRAMGRHEIVWNGQNSAGLSVASGVYLYRFEAGNVVQTHRDHACRIGNIQADSLLWLQTTSVAHSKCQKLAGKFTIGRSSFLTLKQPSESLLPGLQKLPCFQYTRHRV